MRKMGKYTALTAAEFAVVRAELDRALTAAATKALTARGLRCPARPVTMGTLADLELIAAVMSDVVVADGQEDAQSLCAELDLLGTTGDGISV